MLIYIVTKIKNGNRTNPIYVFTIVKNEKICPKVPRLILISIY